MFSFKPKTIVSEQDALEGREHSLPTASHHYVNGASLHPPYPSGLKQIQLGMGCFWGAERLLWQKEGVYVTAVGYSGGHTPNPTYEEVCSGQTGHAETVLVVYDSKDISLEQLLTIFFENHDPTQGMRQGNDIGTQYRSVIYTYDEHDLVAANESKKIYKQALKNAGKSEITTEIKSAPPFYFAEEYHQQYLAKNPSGYCGIGGLGICMPPDHNEYSKTNLAK